MGFPVKIETRVWLVFAISLAIFPMRGVAGVWETLARGSHRVFNSQCTPTTAAGAVSTLPRSETPSTSEHDCDPRVDPVRALQHDLRFLNQEVFFAALADERKKQDQCALDFTRELSGDRFEKYASDLQEKVQLLTQNMSTVLRLNQELSQAASGRNVGVRSERAINRPDVESLRKTLQKHLAAIAAIENSIPLGSHQIISQFINQQMQAAGREAFSNRGIMSPTAPALNPIDNERFRRDLRSALTRTQSAIEKDQQVLQAGVSSGGSGLDRGTRESLAQDRDLIETFFARNPELKNKTQSLVCQIDATYGRGAEARDQALMVGSIATTLGSLGVGALVRGGAAAASISTPARLAAARGVLTIRTARVLSSTAIGLETVSGLQQIDSACFQNQRTTRVTAAGAANTSNRCDSYRVEALNQENCALSVGLTALGIGLSSEAAQRLAGRALRGAPVTEQPLSPAQAEVSRAVRAEQVLGRELTPQQRQAVEAAHLVGENQLGADRVSPARIGNYTREQLAEKTRILQQGGFTSAEERRQLIESGTVGLAETHARIVGLNPAGVPQQYNLRAPESAARIADLPVTDRVNQFRTAYRLGRLEEGNNRFISFVTKDASGQIHRESAEVLRQQNETVRVRFLDPDDPTRERQIERILTTEELATARLSSVRSSDGNASAQAIQEGPLQQPGQMDRLSPASQNPAPGRAVGTQASGSRELAEASPGVNRSSGPRARAVASSPEEQARQARVYRERINTLAPLNDYRRDTTGYWRQWLSPLAREEKPLDIPVQGWKLHVSATPELAGEIAEAVLPYLVTNKIEHKIVSDLAAYRAVTSNRSNTQAGKFITIYPKNPEDANKISEEVSKILRARGLRDDDFVPVPGEESYDTGVYARYGVFYRTPENSGGQKLLVNGEWIPDVRGIARPNGINPLRGERPIRPVVPLPSN